MRIVIPVFNARGGGEARVARAEESDAKIRKVSRREDDDGDTRKADRAEADHKKHKSEAKRDDDDDSDDDSPKAKRAETERKKHKDDDASDDRAEKKTAKAEKIEAVKIAKADKPKEKAEKSVEPASKPEKAAKAEKAPKAETEVAKSEPAKLPKKEDTDKRATGEIATASADSADEASKFRWPARGRIIQGFKSGGNDGINIALPEGTSVRAAEDGKVAYAGSALKGYGNLVLIRHPNGFVTAYANNGELDVKSGDAVKRGQVIAKSGQTGDVSTPQLHFELRRGQTPVDPTNYLAGL